MRVRFPSLLVPRRRRPAGEPRENIGGWREVAPLTVTVSLRPLTTVGPALGGSIRPLATRGLAVPARLTVALGRPVDVRPTVDRLPDLARTRPRRPVPTISRVERTPLPPFATEDPEPEFALEPEESSWTDDDSIAELRAILHAARRQAAESDPLPAGEPLTGGPLTAEPDPEPVADGAAVVRSWPEPGAPPVRLPWEHGEPDTPAAEPYAGHQPAAAGAQESPRSPARAATPIRNRPADPPAAEAPQAVQAAQAPGRRRLSLAESRRRGITVRPRHTERPPAPTIPPAERPPTPEPPAPVAARPEEPRVSTQPAPAEPEQVPAEAPVDREPVPDLIAPAVEPVVAPVDRAPAVEPVEAPVDREPVPVPAETPVRREPDPEPAAKGAVRPDPREEPPPAGPPKAPPVPDPVRQVVVVHGPVVGRLPDVEPAPVINRRPPLLPTATDPARRTPPDSPPAPTDATPVGPSEPAGSTARVRPSVRQPDEPRQRHPRLGLGAPLHRPPTRPAEPVVVQPAPALPPADPPVATTELLAPMTWVIDGDADLPMPAWHAPVPAPAPRQVVTPNPPGRRPGLGAPLTAPRPVRDVSDVTVHRGPAVNEQARAWRARAFTRDGEVYLPDTHDHRTEQATLAHELIHVVQQRTHGDALPPEWTAAGRALEHEAVAAAPQPPAPQAPPHQVEPQPYEQPQRHERLPEPFGVPAGVQRQPDDVMTMTFPQPHQDVEPPQAPEPHRDALAGYREQLIALCDMRTVDMNDSRSVNELAARLYQPLRGMLCGELIVDRERAGLLTDFR